MADETKRSISQLPTAESTSASDLIEIAMPSSAMESGYASRKVSMSELADLIVKKLKYADLNSTEKDIIGAINEALEGGGGSSIEPNPEGEATETLEKIGIDGTVYDLPGGGSGDVTKAYVDQQDANLQSQIDDEKAEIQQLKEHFVVKKTAQLLDLSNFIFGKKINNTALAPIDSLIEGDSATAVSNIIDVNAGETYKTNINKLGKAISLTVCGYIYRNGEYQRSQVVILSDTNGVTEFTINDRIEKIRISICSVYDKFGEIILSKSEDWSEDISPEYKDYTEMIEKVDYANILNVPSVPVSSNFAPKLTMRNCVMIDGNTNNAFRCVNMSYTTVYNTCGAIYGVTQVSNGVQSIYKSIDGGLSWNKVGDLAITGNQTFVEIYVENRSKTIVLLRDNDTSLAQRNFTICTYDEPTMNMIGSMDIGTRDWLSSTHNIDSGVIKGTYTNVIIFGEYAHTYCEPVESVRIWKTLDRGATWIQIKSFNADNGSRGSGEVRHIHGLRIDPYTNDWWLCTGDSNPQCRIYRSQDSGENWELVVSGSQHERTTSFVFEKDYIFFGMDSPDAGIKSSVYKLNKNTLDKSEVCQVYSNYAIYSLTRTLYPKGFLIWTVKESSSLDDDYMVIQFYSYDTNSLVDVAKINISDYGYFTGFNSASNYQDIRTGAIISRASDTFKNDYLGNSVNRSNYFICNLSM